MTKHPCQKRLSAKCFHCHCRKWDREGGVCFGNSMVGEWFPLLPVQLHCYSLHCHKMFVSSSRWDPWRIHLGQRVHKHLILKNNLHSWIWKVWNSLRVFKPRQTSWCKIHTCTISYIFQFQNKCCSVTYCTVCINLSQWLFPLKLLYRFIKVL